MTSEPLAAMIDLLRALPPLTGDPAIDRGVVGTSSDRLPDGFPCERVTVVGRPAMWGAAPGADETAAILYLHGGGYVLGGIDTHGDFAARLATECATRVLLLDYRLGPEHHHPAALDDAVAAWRWLIDDAGLDPSRTVVAGDSAGGGLAVATLAALRDAGHAPAAGVALSPWADLTCTLASHESVGGNDPLVSSAALRGYAAAYAPGVRLDDPALSPLHGDLAGLPPVLVQVGGLEVLRDDSTELAARIEAAGGEVTLQQWDGAPHVFQMFATPESAEAISEIAAFVRRQLG